MLIGMNCLKMILLFQQKDKQKTAKNSSKLLLEQGWEM